MPLPNAKRKRGPDHTHKSRVPKRIKKQKHYHSSGESDDEDLSLDVASRKEKKKSEPREIRDKASSKGHSRERSTPSVSQAAPGVVKTKKHTTVKENSDKEDKDDQDDDQDVDGDDSDEVVENLSDLDDDDAADLGEEDNDEPDIDAEASDASSGSEIPSHAPTKKRKRNDPTAFATSMSKILSSKLTTNKRADPVLSRSVTASTANKEIAEQKLEEKARQKLRADKKAALERGRITDVLGLETEDVVTAEIQERERRLKKTAQRGVVKLFNAVRAAQVQAETARAEARKQGIVGMDQREEKINEMSKQGFLDLIASGGKKDIGDA